MVYGSERVEGERKSRAREGGIGRVLLLGRERRGEEEEEEGTADSPCKALAT